MCESHTIYHLCGHVKIKTLVQCADTIDKLINSGSPITCNHRGCEDDVGDNIHVFPDICAKCKVTGVIGDAMEVPGAKVDALRAWDWQNKGAASPATLHPDKEDSSSEKTSERETLASTGPATDETTLSTSPCGSPARRGRASNSSSDGATHDLSQIKTRVAALVTRTERLLTKMRAGKAPTNGQSSL